METPHPKSETQGMYDTKYIQALVDLYVALDMEYQGLSVKQLELGLEKVDPQLIDEIQLSEEWIKKHS